MPKAAAEIEWDQPALFEVEPVERKKLKRARRPRPVATTDYEQPALFEIGGAA